MALKSNTKLTRYEVVLFRMGQKIEKIGHSRSILKAVMCMRQSNQQLTTDERVTGCVVGICCSSDDCGVEHMRGGPSTGGLMPQCNSQ